MERLTEAEKKTVEAAVEEAEAITTGEIVPVVVPTSANYSYVGHWLGLSGLVLASVLMVTFSPLQTALWELSILFVAQVLGWGLGWTLGHWPPVVRALAGQGRMRTEVQETAHASFLHNGLHRTEGRTGVLLFVSLLEHKVVILADEGIHQKEGDMLWKEECAKIAEGISKGDGPAAVAASIRSIGKKLAVHFPAKSGHHNQLPHGVRER